MLEVKDLTLMVDGKKLLKDINLSIPDGETHVLFGPNGAGKTSLLKAIMGIPPIRVLKGEILLNGKEISKWAIDERARKGIALTFQHPPIIQGVKLGTFMRAYGKYTVDAEFLAEVKALDLERFLDRDLNSGFSGGELKRSELMQVRAQHPSFVMIDEPESGVDLEHISMIGQIINEVLKRKQMIRLPRDVSGLIVTHTGFILDYVNAERGYIINKDGVICQGNPRDIFSHIQRFGFDRCELCAIRTSGACNEHE